MRMSRRMAIYSQGKRSVELDATWYQCGVRGSIGSSASLANNQIYNDTADFMKAGRVYYNSSYDKVYAVGIAFDTSALADAAARGTPKSVKLRMYVASGALLYDGSVGSAINIGVSTKYNAYTGSEIYSYAYQHNGELTAPSVITPATAGAWVDIDLGTTIPTYGYVLCAKALTPKTVTVFGLGSAYMPKLLIEY